MTWPDPRLWPGRVRQDHLWFLGHVIAALRTIVSKVGETADELLCSPQPPPVESILTVLLNELCALPDDAVLVLDDYHALDNPAVHDAVVFLLDHLPPQIHLVTATRADPPLPLARRRSRGHLVEIRTDDLRFTLDESAAFLNRATGLNLAAESIADLEARTEGWMVGLASLVTFIPFYLVRAPREEKMMLDHFGEEYRTYMRRTGRIMPRLRK